MADKTNKTLEFWDQQFWAKNDAPWQLEDPNEALVKHLDKLVVNQNDRILVPLCGKSVDMKWLYEKGYNVVGVEGEQCPPSNHDIYEVSRCCRADRGVLRRIKHQVREE